MRLDNRRPNGIRVLFVLLACILCLNLWSQENCTNGLDDDGDGLIDLNDVEDCNCEVVEIENIIPNPSFEELADCCPDGVTQLVCAQDWYTPSLGTSDFINTCDLFTPCAPQPFPDGEGVMGAIYGILDFTEEPSPYHEYIATCLPSELQPDVSYTLQFFIAATATENLEVCFPLDYSSVDVTIFGLEVCDQSNLFTEDCPVSFGWTELGSVTYTPVEEWNLVTIEFTPTTPINSLMLGPQCGVLDPEVFSIGPSGEVLYCFYDGLVLNESEPFASAISQEGGNCQSDLILSVSNTNNASLQWYYEGVALEGEVEDSLNLGATGYNTGVYQVRITNEEENTCEVLETTVSPEENNPIQFEADVLIGCAPLEVSFINLTAPDFAESFQWNFETGTSTAFEPTFTFEQPGIYDISLTAISAANCVLELTLENYIEVLPTGGPEVAVNILNDCSPYSVVFENNVPEMATCFWDFGGFGTSNDCSPQIVIDEEGSYIATLSVSGIVGCTEDITTEFSVSPDDPPSFTLTGPASICNGGSDTLEAVFGNGSVEWFDGTIGSRVEITDPGTYTATFTRADGCSKTDSITIPEKLPPSIRVSDVNGCLGDTIRLRAEAEGAQLRWSGQPEGPVLNVSEPGIYTVTATNACGTAEEEAEVTLKDCECHVYIPNGFTPNADGINDLFKPSISCELNFYELIIFNRWGNKVFHSKNPDESWNGAGQENKDYFVGSEIFNYVLRYDNALRSASEIEEIRGSIFLVR